MAKNTEDVTTRLKLERGAQFRKGMQDAGKGIDKFGKTASKANRRLARLGLTTEKFRRVGDRVRHTVTLASTALVGLGAIGIKQAIANASDLNEETTKTQQIFGRASASIMSFASKSAKALGMSKTQALGFSGQIGGLFKNAGKSAGDAAKLSKSIVGLSSDLASFFNTNPDEAFLALRSGLSGESEPLRRYNVFLSEAAVQQEGVRIGLVKGTDQLTQQQKVLARYSLIMRQTKDAQGDFARTSNGLANQQRILRAELTNLSAKVGGKLLPIVNQGVKALNRFVDGMENGTGAGGKFVDKAKSVGKAVDRYVIRPLGAAAKWIAKSHDRTTALAVGIGTLTAAVVAFGIATAVAASPVYLVIAAIGALAAGFYYAYQRSETFRKALGIAWAVLKHVPVVEVVRHLDDIVKFMVKLPGRVSSAATGMWDGLKTGVVAAINFCIDKVNWLIRAFNNTLGRVPGVPNVGELDKIGSSQGPTKDDLNALRHAPSPSRAGSERQAMRDAHHRNNRAQSQEDSASAARRRPIEHSTTKVYLDGREVSHSMLKRSRNRARRR